MYVFQMNDGSWRISLKTSAHLTFGAILLNAEAYRLYNRIYDSEHVARHAERRIRSLIEAAA